MNIIRPLSDWNRKRLAKRRAAKKKNYQEWISHYDNFEAKTMPANARGLASEGQGPRISIALPLRTDDARVIVACVESIRHQLYSNWELCIAGHASTDALIGEQLRALAKADARIRYITAHEAGISLMHLAIGQCTGPCIAAIGDCGSLPAHALLFIGKALKDEPKLSFLYVDDDHIDSAGNRLSPRFKPDWNEYLLRSGNYIGHFFVFKNGLQQGLHEAQSGPAAAEDYDLILKCTEQLDAAQIGHIPFVLYHAPSKTEARALPGHQQALQQHYERKGVGAIVEITDQQQLRTRYALPAQLPTVSIVIPSKDRPQLLRKCVSSILHKTRYPNFDIVFIDNGTTDPEAIDQIKQLLADPRFKVIEDASPFNYSRLNNAAVRQSSGQYVCLMNNDVEIIDPNWLHEMVSVAIQPGVGAVGARLLYPDTSLQHVGVIVGLGGVAGHAFKGMPAGDPCYMDRAVVVQEYSAVTAACLLTPRAVYDRVGGLNEEHLTIAFNDIDYCLKVRESGDKVIYTPYAEFFHHESASRGKEDTREKKLRFAGECQYMKTRWGHWFARDPAYNPNLTINFEDFSLATPPKATPRHFLQSPFSAHVQPRTQGS